MQLAYYVVQYEYKGVFVFVVYYVVVSTVANEAQHLQE